MKVYFGFNAINQDGMGSAAMNLLSALKKMDVKVQPVHPWKSIAIPEYFKFSPKFLSENNYERPLGECVREMIEVVNNDPECTIFSHFGSSNWGAIIPYLRSDIRVVVSVHSVTPSALKIALANHERVSKFIAVSWEVERKLRVRLPKKDHWKISLVPNAIDINNHPIKRTFTDVCDQIKIIYFGRVEDYTKGADKIPKIAKLLMHQGLNFNIDIYGYFHWGYEKRFYEQIRRNGVGGVIKYKGCLTPIEIPSVLQNYDIMIMPSNHEGFGISLLESMAAGLTSIVSRLHNVTDRIVSNGREGVLVGKNDISGFAREIMIASANPKLREAIGIAARAKVSQCFSIEQHGRNYRDVFESAMADNSYVCLAKSTDFDKFVIPESLKPHILARLLPNWLKRVLKKII